MKYSQLFTKTSKDTPAGETSRNAQLLMRAGYIDKTMAGAYSYLTLGYRVLHKIEGIVRKELDAIGGQEVQLSLLSPREIWQKTNRWETIPEYFILQSQSGNEYRPTPTAEEIITPLVGVHINSWKDLTEYDETAGTFPISVYQIHTKFRDELRAKSGIMRGREFRMMDMYSFHRDKDKQREYYETVTEAYLNAYANMGIEAYPINASGGVFTKKVAREFQAICVAGEDKTLFVPNTTYYYNQEVAPALPGKPNDANEVELEREDHELHDVIGVEALCKALNTVPEKTTKTLFFEDENGTFFVAVLRGDYDLNEEKLMKIHGLGFSLASDEKVREVTGATIGYAGLIDLPEGVKVYVDNSCEGLKNFEMGTNKDGFHSINVNFGRDILEPREYVDIKVAEEGDIHPESGGNYQVHITAEVGHIFDLEKNFSEPLGVRYIDENNQVQVPEMGCYGIGTSRCMGVVAENTADENGLRWPKNIAPFVYHVIPHINPKDETELQEKIAGIADYFYEKLGTGDLFLCKNEHKFKVRGDACANHKEVVVQHGKIYDPYLHDRAFIDDRAGESLGSKLKDADLLGMPYQIIITKRSLEQGGVEVKDRWNGDTFIVKLPEILQLKSDEGAW